jgi:hypothetical protein
MAMRMSSILALARGHERGALEAALYASRRSKRGHRRVAEPEYSTVGTAGRKAQAGFHRSAGRLQ